MVAAPSRNQKIGRRLDKERGRDRGEGYPSPLQQSLRRLPQRLLTQRTRGPEYDVRFLWFSGPLGEIDRFQPPGLPPVRRYSAKPAGRVLARIASIARSTSFSTRTNST